MQSVIPPAPEESPSVEALIARGQAAERDGHRGMARQHFEDALYQIRSDSEAAQSVSLSRWIGRIHLLDGDAEAAIDCAELSLALAETLHDAAGIAHALNLLGGGWHLRGDLDQATEFYTRARDHAALCGVTRLVAMVEQNLGIIANIRGDLATALERYQASLAAFRTAGMGDAVGYVLNNLGMLFTDLQRWAEAEDAFEEALESSVRSGNAATQTMIEVNRTELAIAQRQYERARSFCDSASKLARKRKDLRALSELHKHYGVIHRETGELSSAEAHLARAFKLAEDRDDLLLAAEVLREQADLFARQERNHDTLRCLNQAHQLFERLQARRDIAAVDGRMARLEARFVELVIRWGESIESADRYTQGHCVRVADFACALARTAGFDEKTLFWFRLGALLHDVGKIIVPIDVLNKPGQLSPEERAIIERHPDAGVAFLADIDFPWDIRPMVRHHHERWDGKGYPTGLAGEEIPLSARILCIADVYDALTSDRPYRAGFSQERALDIMTTSMASHFDPELLQRWQELCHSGVTAELASAAGAAATADQDGGAGAMVRAGDSARLRVLVIARNFADANSLRAASDEESERVEITHVVRIADAVHRLREESFDAIVLGLPLDEGREAQPLVQLQEHAPEAPVLLLADQADETLALQALRSGAQDFLVRTEISGSMLLRAIRYAVERNRLRMDLQAKSLLDDLTGLYNRRGFFTVAGQQMKLAGRRKDRLAVMFADVNAFKEINDEFGHREGDLALVDIATLFKSTFRQSDLLARMGGDEFVALISGASADAVATLVDRLTKHLELYNIYAGRRYQLSISIGSAIWDPSSPSTLDDLLRHADRAMYQEKQHRVRPYPRVEEAKHLAGG